MEKVAFHKAYVTGFNVIGCEDLKTIIEIVKTNYSNTKSLYTYEYNTNLEKLFRELSNYDINPDNIFEGLLYSCEERKSPNAIRFSYTEMALISAIEGSLISLNNSFTPDFFDKSLYEKLIPSIRQMLYMNNNKDVCESIYKDINDNRLMVNITSVEDNFNEEEEELMAVDTYNVILTYMDILTIFDINVVTELCTESYNEFIEMSKSKKNGLIELLSSYYLEVLYEKDNHGLSFIEYKDISDVNPCRAVLIRLKNKNNKVITSLAYNTSYPYMSVSSMVCTYLTGIVIEDISNTIYKISKKSSVYMSIENITDVVRKEFKNLFVKNVIKNKHDYSISRQDMHIRINSDTVIQVHINSSEADRIMINYIVRKENIIRKVVNRIFGFDINYLTELSINSIMHEKTINEIAFKVVSGIIRREFIKEDSGNKEKGTIQLI